MRVFVLVLSLTLAGCVKPPTADEGPVEIANVATPPVAAPTPTNGALSVLAVFADKTPLAGVNITVDDVSRTTDATGMARFDQLSAGTHTLVATKTAHRAAQQQVSIVGGETASVEVVLAAEDGGQHAHKVGFGAHTDLYAFDGHFDCTTVYVIIPGDCLIVVENATHVLGVPDPVSNTTSEKNVIEFALDLNWTAMAVELIWSEPELPASDGMTLALEPAEAPVDGHSAKYARVNGSVPLRIDLVPGVKHATATQDDMPNADGGEVLRARMFVRGHAHNPGGTEYLGVGFAKDFKFKLYASVFYGEAMPPGYTAIPAS